MTLKEVLNVFEKDYPEVCLYELGEKVKDILVEKMEWINLRFMQQI